MDGTRAGLGAFELACIDDADAEAAEAHQQNADAARLQGVGRECSKGQKCRGGAGGIGQRGAGAEG